MKFRSALFALTMIVSSAASAITVGAESSDAGSVAVAPAPAVAAAPAPVVVVPTAVTKESCAAANKVFVKAYKTKAGKSVEAKCRAKAGDGKASKAKAAAVTPAAK